VRRFDQTTLSLNARFSALDGAPGLRFVVDESITIEIERKISGPHVPFHIPIVIQADYVTVNQRQPTRSGQADDW